jgi:two-component system cell cycle response regulator
MPSWRQSSAAREKCCGSDIKCRYGGEEFLVLLPETPRAGAKQVAETRRREISEARVPWNTATVTVSTSFGVAVGLAAEVDPAALFGRADTALYRAKQESHNCVRIAAEAVPCSVA